MLQVTEPTPNIIAYSDDERLGKIWARAFDAWLSHFSAEGTVHAYKDAWRYFLDFSRLPPWRVGRSVLVEYYNAMHEQGLSDSTIQLRLAGLSSFFDFVTRDYTVIDQRGREVPLHDINPATSKLIRKRLQPYTTAQYLTKDEIKKFLAVFDQETVRGRRDYALFLTYLLTGRRSREVLGLRWGDIRDEGDFILYTWSGKNTAARTSEMPRPVYSAILAYLDAAGRLATIQPADYIFIATVVYSASYDASQPLSNHEVGRIIRRTCKAAGIDKRLTCHGLRHTATMLRRSTGEPIEDVSKFLNHRNFHTTSTYLHAIEGYRDHRWKKVGKMLEL